MNNELVVTLMNRLGSIDPPGCLSEFVEHPFPPYRKSHCVEVGFVLEHRFAFYYWIKCKQKLQLDRRTNARTDDEGFMPPDLVTWDWHDDVGAECDYIESELLALNQADEEEVALFCWAGLRQINDGHIAPALWLNAIGNVYVIQKQRRDCKSENRSFTDRFGHEHQVFYFRSLKDFPTTFERTNNRTGVIWDIDMDYFTQGRSVDDQWYTPPLSGQEITAMFQLDILWMPLILKDLKAVTIALEPKYTGGLSVSLELYRHWESALFAAPLFNKKCRWRKEISKALA
jgi:hypothetical protein